MNPEAVQTVTVSGESNYDILIGRGNRMNIAELVPAGVKKIMILHAPTMGKVAAELRESMMGQYEVMTAELPDAEAAKRIEVASFCWQLLGQSDFTRSDLIIGLGGGAITDIAGFVAATWLRGLKIIQVPTTVLAMVDAGIGGKTGINTSEGKNLVGSFHAPHAVVVDLEFLQSLPEMELKAGFAEVVKCGFIREPEILDLIEADVATVLNPDSAEMLRVIQLSIQTKADIVSADYKETGEREYLNYGHTLGHAIEYVERYQWRHGAAISIGLMYAAELGRLSGRLSDEVADRHRTVLELLGLPTSYGAKRWDSLLAVMKRDKKSRGNMLRFVVLDDLARPTILAAPEPSLIFAAYQEITA
ncbi:MAG: 3-dehydroquinate synthase [Microbacteriaceae bacterium]